MTRLAQRREREGCLTPCSPWRAQVVREEWMRGRPVEGLRVSTPPFNHRPGVELPGHVLAYNIPVYGVRIPDSVMELFKLTGLAKHALPKRDRTHPSLTIPA